MELVQIPFTFRYLAEDDWQCLTLLPHNGWYPLKPLVDALGMKWSRQRTVLQHNPDMQIKKVPGSTGFGAMCMQAEPMLAYLKGINLRKVSKPDRVKFFQTYFPPALEDYLKLVHLEQEIAEEVPDIEPENDSEWLSEDEAKDISSEMPLPIYVDYTLGAADFARRDLLRVGVRGFAEIDYIMSSPIIVLLKPNPKDPEGKPLKAAVHSQSYESGDLIRAAKNGFYPIPEFFRRFPSLYRQQTQYTQQIERNEFHKAVSHARRLKGLGGAPWYEEKFAASMVKLQLMREAQAKEAEIAAAVEQLRLGELEAEELQHESDDMEQPVRME